MGGVHLPSRSLPLSPFTFPASPFILPVLPMSDPLIDRLKILIVATLKLEGVRPEEIPDDEPLIGSPRFGLDSIDALELVLALEKEFGVKIGSSEESRQALTSVATIAAFIRAHAPGA
jgi:acyl carrier protein